MGGSHFPLEQSVSFSFKLCCNRVTHLFPLSCRLILDASAGVIPHLKFLSKNKKVIEEKAENKKNLYYIKPHLIEYLENYFNSNEV